MQDSAQITAEIVGSVFLPVVLTSEQTRRLLDSVEDTMAVAFAGWNEPVVEKVRAAYPGEASLSLFTNLGRTPDAAALLLGTAAHALDYDDVHLRSVTHPSAVILPTLICLGANEVTGHNGFLESYAVGLAVTAGIGELLDFSHYEAGWHATSTIGALTACVAGCRLAGLDENATRNALSIAASQAAGMQRNFGTDAKPLQAGLAASAAVRSVLLARAGVGASADIFGPRGFLDLYAPNRAGSVMTPLAPGTDRVSVKLYPCCYAAHRMVAAATEMHARIGSISKAASLALDVPEGLMTPLNVLDPASGNEAKFCGKYAVAAALIQGTLGLTDFQDAAVHRPDIRDLMGRTKINEIAGSGHKHAGIDHGEVVLKVIENGDVTASVSVRNYPGSPELPASSQQLEKKILDCLEIYRNRHNGGPGLADFRQAIQLNCSTELEAA